MSKNQASGGLSQFAPTVSLSGTAIDWSQGNIFSKTTSVGFTFSFTNNTDGRTIVIQLINSTGSNIAVAWPGSIIGAYTSLTASKTAIITLIKVGSNTYSSALEF